MAWNPRKSLSGPRERKMGHIQPSNVANAGLEWHLHSWEDRVGEVLKSISSRRSVHGQLVCRTVDLRHQIGQEGLECISTAGMIHAACQECRVRHHCTLPAKNVEFDISVVDQVPATVPKHRCQPGCSPLQNLKLTISTTKALTAA